MAEVNVQGKACEFEMTALQGRLSDWQRHILHCRACRKIMNAGAKSRKKKTTLKGAVENE